MSPMIPLALLKDSDPGWSGKGSGMLHHCEAEQGAWPALEQTIPQVHGEDGVWLLHYVDGRGWRCHGDDFCDLSHSSESRKPTLPVLQVNGGCCPLHSAYVGGWYSVGTSDVGHLA